MGKLIDSFIKTAAAEAIIRSVGDVAIRVADATTDLASKKQVPFVKIPQSRDYYIGRNYLEVKSELEAYGFENILLKAQHDLINGWLVKDGSVADVLISGKSDFRKGSKFPAAIQISIIYHTFK